VPEVWDGPLRQFVSAISFPGTVPRLFFVRLWRSLWPGCVVRAASGESWLAVGDQRLQHRVRFINMSDSLRHFESLEAGVGLSLLAKPHTLNFLKKFMLSHVAAFAVARPGTVSGCTSHDGLLCLAHRLPHRPLSLTCIDDPAQ